MSDPADRLQYLRTDELREEIVYTAGGDPERYTGDPKRGLLKADVRRVATALQPEDDDHKIAEMDLCDLYEVVCEWADADYHPNAGNAWGLRRDNLKQIHRALDAQPPREVQTV